MSNPYDVLAHAAYILVDGVQHAMNPTFGAAAAIVVATVLIRFVLLPVASAQHRADRRRAELLSALPADASAREKVLREQGGGLLRGFVPMLVQLPIFAGIYRLAVSPTIQGHTNTLLQHTLFGAPLGAHLAALAGPQLAVFLGLVAMIAVIGHVSARVLRPAGPAPTGAAAVIGRVAPYASAVFALFLPLAAALYVATTAAWTLGQTIFLRSI